MKKWAEMWAKKHPPRGYGITYSELNQLFDLAQAGDLYHALGTAYNYGFQKGRNCEARKQRSMK